VRIKLRRAADLTAELREKVAPLAIIAEQSIDCIRCADRSSRLECRVRTVPTVDPMVAAIVGDIVHNLRSALDHLAWQLVRLDGGQPDETTAFPIHLSSLNGRGNPRNLTIAPGIRRSDIMEAVESMQPYDALRYGHPPETDALGILQRLNNIDKHRLLLTVVHTIDHDMPAYWGSNDGDPSPTYWFNTELLKPGDVVATFDFGEFEPPPSFHPDFSLVVTIEERDANWGRGHDVVELMRALHHSVESDINIHIVPLVPGEAFVWTR
jgi:hypothetical protein